MAEKRVKVPEKEWIADTTTAIRKYLPAGFDPSTFIHQEDGSMVLVYDDEKPSTPSPAPTETLAQSEPVKEIPDVPQLPETHLWFNNGSKKNK